MTFAAYEESIKDGAPVELHEFKWGTQVYRFTSAEQDYLDGEGATWTAVPIVRDSISDSQAESRSDLSVRVDISNPVVTPFRLSSPIIEYTLYQVHLDDPDQELSFLFSGRVNDLVITPENELSARLTATSLMVVLDDPGLRRKLQLRCPHSLYDTNCKVDQNAYPHTAVVSEVTGRLVSLNPQNFPAKPSSFFVNGFIEYFRDDGAYTERRFIMRYLPLGAAALLELDYSAIGLDVGVTITMYPGCARTMQVCNATFNNLDNFGGCPYTPSKDPFSSDPFT